MNRILTWSNFVSAVVGAVAACIGVFISIYLFPATMLERLDARIEIEDLKPEFDVRYYGLSTRNKMFEMLREGTNLEEKITNPLFKARRVSIKDSKLETLFAIKEGELIKNGFRESGG